MTKPHWYVLAIFSRLDLYWCYTIQTAGIVFDGTASTHLTLADGTTARNGERFLVSGGSGNDSLRGGAGNDSFRGGTGNTLDGGAGEDSLGLDLSDQTVGIVFDSTASTHLALADGTTARKGERFSVSGGTGNDSLRGGADSDFLSGGLGNDNLRGGAGDDFLFGDDGDDSLFSGVGNDSLSGGTGNDSLRGGAGIDTLAGASSVNFGVGSIDILTGGSELDLFILGASSGVFYDRDQVNSPASTDYAEITDFDFSQDGIRLTGAAINYNLVEGIVPNTGLSGTSIYLAGQPNELIAVVTDVTGLDLNASYFSYV